MKAKEFLREWQLFLIVELSGLGLLIIYFYFPDVWNRNFGMYEYNPAPIPLWGAMLLTAPAVIIYGFFLHNEAKKLYKIVKRFFKKKKK